MHHETDQAERLPAAKPERSHLGEAILQERISSYSGRDTKPPSQTAGASGDFVSIEIHINKKAVDAIGKLCNEAVKFFPNLIIEGSRAAEREINNAQQQITKSASDASRWWNHGVSEVGRGFNDASIHTYKTINSSVESMQRGATDIAVGTERAAVIGLDHIQRQASNAVHVTEHFAQQTTHDLAKASSLQLCQWANLLDPDRSREKR